MLFTSTVYRVNTSLNGKDDLATVNLNSTKVMNSRPPLIAEHSLFVNPFSDKQIRILLLS